MAHHTEWGIHSYVSSRIEYLKIFRNEGSKIFSKLQMLQMS